MTVLTTDAGLPTGDAPARGQEVLRNGVKVYYFPQVPGYGIKSPALEAAIGDFVKAHDLIHVTAIWQRTGPAACRTARRAGTPYVISPRGALGPYSWQRGLLKKTAYYWLHERRNLVEASGFHYTSTLEATECERFRFGKPAAIVPNSIDHYFWKRDEVARKLWRTRYGYTDDDTVLLYAGRLHHKKGLDLLPEVIAQCHEKACPVKLVLVGPEEDDTGRLLRASFAKLGLDRWVQFLPMLLPEELRMAYSSADIFVLPSRHENFGNAAVEAAACGCRVLTSKYVGIGEDLMRLGYGECLERNPADWVKIITQRRAITDYNVSLLLNAFSVTIAVQNMEAFYQRIM